MNLICQLKTIKHFIVVKNNFLGSITTKEDETARLFFTNKLISKHSNYSMTTMVPHCYFLKIDSLLRFMSGCCIFGKNASSWFVNLLDRLLLKRYFLALRSMIYGVKKRTSERKYSTLFNRKETNAKIQRLVLNTLKNYANEFF